MTRTGFTQAHVHEHFDREYHTFLVAQSKTPATIMTEDNARLDDFFAVSGDALARMTRTATDHAEQDGEEDGDRGTD